MSARSNGGKVKALNVRAHYNDAPNKCLYCGADILSITSVPLAFTRKKTYCNRSCAARHNAPRTAKIKSLRRTRNYCICGKEIRAKSLKCVKCTGAARELLSKRTKDDLFKSCKHYQIARSQIQSLSLRNFKSANVARSCIVCGYSKHVDVAHIKSVSSFSSTSLVSEICDVNNLCALCPNHHWEYDHGQLDLTRYIPATNFLYGGLA